MNLILDLLVSTLTLGTPLILAALGGVISERGGVVNIALEGMMLLGAFSAAAGSYYFNNPYAGLVIGMAAGLAASLLHAVLCIRWKADQIVAGVGINILSSGLTAYLLFRLFNTSANSPEVPSLPWQAFAVGAFALAALMHLLLYYTPQGLWIRAVGEHPRAAETAGISVTKVRYACVLASGVLAGMAGAYLSISHLHGFTREMTAGRGFIALAAVIFGKWTPFGALGAGLFFGLADALQFMLAGHVNIPSQFLNSFPYAVTILLLTGAIGKATPPAADGIPYDSKNAR